MDLKQYRRVGVAIAMESEAESLLGSQPFAKISEAPYPVFNIGSLFVLCCGYGTLNAALGTQVLIKDYGCECVVNFGVCGYTGMYDFHGILFTIPKVYKRDIDCRVIGCERYAYPGDVSFLEPKTDDKLPKRPLYTSDEFVGRDSDVVYDVLVDMEGYSVAFTCRRYNIDCYLFKSVCDNTEENVDRRHYDAMLDGALVGMEEYINKMFADYLA